MIFSAEILKFPFSLFSLCTSHFASLFSLRRLAQFTEIQGGSTRGLDIQ